MSLRIDQATYDTGGLLTNGDSRSLIPGPVPTATAFAEWIAGTLPEHWWPLDDDPAAMIAGKGRARDIGRLGPYPAMAGYADSSAGDMRTEDPSLSVQYRVDEAHLKTGGLRRGMSHIPPSTLLPNPRSLEFNRADSGMGSVKCRLSQSIVGSNCTMMFFFRPKSWISRKHDSTGYGDTPWQARILGQYSDMSSAPTFAFDVNTQGRLSFSWGGSRVYSDPLNLNQIYQVLVVSTFDGASLFLNGVFIGYAATGFGGGLAGPSGAGAQMWVGGFRIENYVDRGFQGEISNIAIWSYPMDLTIRRYGLPYIPTYIAPMRNLALMMATPVGVGQAGAVRKDVSYEMRTIVRTGAARPVLKTDGPTPPPSKFGLARAETTRLLISSLQESKLALVSTVGGESTPGTEIVGGGYVRQSPGFTIADGVATSSSMRFDNMPPVSLHGWELWVTGERRWYGYWSLMSAAWTIGVITADSHGLSQGDKVVFPVGSTPTGLSSNTPYYVRDVTTSTFRVSASSGGSAVAIAGTGTAQFGRTLEVTVGDSVEIEAGHLKLRLG